MTHICPILLPPSNFIWLDVGDLRFGLPILVCSHPLASNPTQHNTGAARLYAEKNNNNTTLKPTGHQVTKASHCSCAWPLHFSLHRQEDFASWKRVQKKRGWGMPSYGVGVSISHPHTLLPTTHISLKNHPSKAVHGQLSLWSCWFYHLKAENRLFHRPLTQSIKNSWFLRNDPEVIPSRAATLMWNCRIQTTFQCKYQLR